MCDNIDETAHILDAQWSFQFHETSQFSEDCSKLNISLFIGKLICHSHFTVQW
jgi:hypothetical protein